ncbi:hypothetical protein Hanom_Chr01g00052671 [Helianthus anomalus]
MGEDTLDFEAAKKAFAEEREKFNAEKKGLSWREIACEWTNKELQTQREAIVRLSGEKTKISDEAEQERAAHRKREQEYVERIAKLEKFAEEKIAKSKASEILVEEVAAECKWLLARAVPLEGYAEGRATVEAKEPLKSFDLYKTECVARYAEKQQEFKSLEFAIVKVAGKLSRKPDGITLLKRALGEDDREAGGASTSHQE